MAALRAMPMELPWPAAEAMPPAGEIKDTGHQYGLFFFQGTPFFVALSGNHKLKTQHYMCPNPKLMEAEDVLDGPRCRGAEESTCRVFAREPPVP